MQLKKLDPVFIASLKEETWATPDIHELQRKKAHNVFIYNEHQSVFGTWMNDYRGSFSGTMFTVDRYTMWRQQLGEFEDPRAIVVENKWPHIDQERIKGEVYNIPTDYIPKLDNYMLNTVEFQRRREQLIYPFRHKWRDPEGKMVLGPWRIDIVFAWMYVGITSYWNQHIDAGWRFKPCRIFNLNKHHEINFAGDISELFYTNKYYAHSLLELNVTNNTEAPTVP